MYNENVMNNDPFIRDFVTLNKLVISYLPRCTYHLLYSEQVKVRYSDVSDNQMFAIQIPTVFFTTKP